MMARYAALRCGLSLFELALDPVAIQISRVFRTGKRRDASADRGIKSWNRTAEITDEDEGQVWANVLTRLCSASHRCYCRRIFGEAQPHSCCSRWLRTTAGVIVQFAMQVGWSLWKNKGIL